MFHQLVILLNCHWEVTTKTGQTKAIKRKTKRWKGLPTRQRSGSESDRVQNVSIRRAADVDD